MNYYCCLFKVFFKVKVKNCGRVQLGKILSIFETSLKSIYYRNLMLWSRQYFRNIIYLCCKFKILMSKVMKVERFRDCMNDEWWANAKRKRSANWRVNPWWAILNAMWTQEERFIWSAAVPRELLLKLCFVGNREKK